MLQFEELRQRLEGLYPQIQDLAGAIGLPQMKREAEELDMKAAADGFWDDMETAQKVTQRAALLKDGIERYEKLVRDYHDTLTLIGLADEEGDLSVLEECAAGVGKVEEALDEQRLATLLTGEYDARNAILMACRAAGISAQDAVFSDINDKEGLQRDLEMTRTLGFDGKTCVHPRQIDAVNACFTPSAKEIRNAERVLAALDEAAKNHTGVCTLDGSMVDKPMELRARTTLAKAAAAGIKIGGVQA